MNKEKTEVLDEFSLQVKKIEDKAENILIEAHNKKDEIIANAKTDSITMLTKKKEQLEMKKDEKVKRQKNKIDQEKDFLIKESQKELKQIERKARKNVPDAVDFVIRKLEQKIDDLK